MARQGPPAKRTTRQRRWRDDVLAGPAVAPPANPPSPAPPRRHRTRRPLQPPMAPPPSVLRQTHRRPQRAHPNPHRICSSSHPTQRRNTSLLPHRVAGEVAARRVSHELHRHAVVLQRVVQLVRLRDRHPGVARVRQDQRRRLDLARERDRRLLAVLLLEVAGPRRAAAACSASARCRPTDRTCRARSVTAAPAMAVFQSW